MNKLDEFFGDVMGDLDNLTIKYPVSECCSAKPFGELYENFGRCSGCLEMSEFSEVQE